MYLLALGFALKSGVLWSGDDLDAEWDEAEAGPRGGIEVEARELKRDARCVGAVISGSTRTSTSIPVATASKAAVWRGRGRERNGEGGEDCWGSDAMVL